MIKIWCKVISNEQIKTVNSFLKTNFEKDLFKASIDNLNEINNKLRFNNFAYSMRELLRNFFQRESPDENIKNCIWYAPQGDTEITRRHRIKYFLQGGLSDKYVLKELGININQNISKLIKKIDQLSKFTHIEIDTFDLNVMSVNQLSEELIVAIIGILNDFKNCRDELENKIIDRVNDDIINHTLENLIDNLDVLATHHCVDYVSTDSIKIIKIDDTLIQFKVSGVIEVVLQYGSNSDLSTGIGSINYDSYPFTCELTSGTEEPEEYDFDESTFIVDTSSFYE